MTKKKGCECKEHYIKTNKDRDGGIISVRMVAINEKGEEMGIKNPTAKQITELGRAKIDKQKNDVTFKSK